MPLLLKFISNYSSGFCSVAYPSGMFKIKLDFALLAVLLLLLPGVHFSVQTILLQ
jgi:hypothetical protein